VIFLLHAKHHNTFLLYRTRTVSFAYHTVAERLFALHTHRIVGEHMKKATLIHSEISYVIAKMGHYDAITICDAGLPIPSNVQRIDLAVTQGIPSFMDTLKAIASEMEIESVELAEEFQKASPDLHETVTDYIALLAKLRRKKITTTYSNYEKFKKHTKQSLAIIRTGECTPYANITLKSGVVF
jgi:D-ribose pyranase